MKETQALTLKDLDYSYPEKLIATKPQRPSRILLNQGGANSELSKEKLLGLFQPGDVLVVNDTKVTPKRIFTDKDTEILFLDPVGDGVWTALFPAKKLKVGDILNLPGGVSAELIEKSFPLKIKLSQNLDEPYFLEHGHPALPPYIQKARGERKAQQEDYKWYQTDWAEKVGSSAAPTASLHFTNNDLEALKQKGVKLCFVTLHVGLGTFMPLRNDDVTSNELHSEFVSLSKETIEVIGSAKGKVWAMGTTVTRSLESYANGLLEEGSDRFSGSTKLFIYPGYQFKIVSALLTNFHQPKSSLLALVFAFSDMENVKKAYQYAIQKEFKLFSYGDLSIWLV